MKQLFCIYIFLIISLSLFTTICYGDNYQCPSFQNGTYPDKFQTSGDNSSIWTLVIQNSNNNFVTITNGVTWAKRSVSQMLGVPSLVCEGFVNGSKQNIKVYFPLFYSAYWKCNVTGNSFNCTIK